MATSPRFWQPTPDTRSPAFDTGNRSWTFARAKSRWHELTTIHTHLNGRRSYSMMMNRCIADSPRPFGETMSTLSDNAAIAIQAGVEECYSIDNRRMTSAVRNLCHRRDWPGRAQSPRRMQHLRPAATAGRAGRVRGNRPAPTTTRNITVSAKATPCPKRRRIIR